MSTIEVTVPDIGDFKDVPVITILVKPGDHVGVDDPLIELESDKATLEVPSPAVGDVRQPRGPELDDRIGSRHGDGTPRGGTAAIAMRMDFP